MTEDFPQANSNEHELVHVYVESELGKAGIALQRIGIDPLKKTCTVTTNTKVPEKIKSDVSQFADRKGITINFLTLG